MHAGGHAPAVQPGQVLALATPPPSAPRVPAPIPPPAPIDPETAPTEDIDALGDALVLLAMSSGGDDVSVRQAAQEVARRRVVPLAEAQRIVAAAGMQNVAVGLKRKNMDPETHARLLGETRARLFAVFKTAMSKENFGKGGAAAAMKALAGIAVIDGCQFDGLVQIVGHVTHDHEHRVIDPERAVIAEGLLEMFRRRRVIDVEAEEVAGA